VERDLTTNTCSSAVDTPDYKQLILDTLPLGVVVQDSDGKIISVNASAERILGLSQEQMRGLCSLDPAWHAVHEDGSPFPGDTHPAMQALRSREPVHGVVMGVFNPQTAQHCWIRVDATPIHDAVSGRVRAVYAVFQDISEQKQVEQELRARDAEFRIAVQSSSDGFWIANLQGQLLEANAAYSQLSGYSQDELRQLRISDLDPYDTPDEVAARMQRIVRTGHERFAAVHRAKDGRRWPVEVVATYSAMASGRFFCFIKDLTEQQRSAELIWHQANFDRLTDLPNRALFFDRLSQECSAARRNGKLVALLFADLDAFKAVNDRYGHDAGDAVLQTVASRWLLCVRGTDTIARLGGDEFAIIVGNLDSTREASAIANKLIRALAEDLVLPQGESCDIGVSIGVAFYPDNALEMDSLSSAADQAMYQAKAAGKNRYAFSDTRTVATTAGPQWITFTDAHLIGVAVLDDQHRQLARMVNELNHDLSAEVDDTPVENRFDALINFTLHHFQTEHAYMVEHRYPDAKAHDDEHGQLTNELRLILKKKQREGDLLVLQKIKDWLLTHIQNADKALGRYLNQQGVY
jgi:diguanylate cyclase (GGDEF)-like protein/hemerythrin-like metal-binding protein/PAS domain S-box-containing protein